MSEDDIFIREVNDELRQDKLLGLWKRFGPLLIGAAVALVLGTAAWSAWTWWQAKQAGASGDRFLAALTLAGEGKTDEADAALKALEADGYGAYPVLARLRQATLLVQEGKSADAVAAFDKVAADTAVPEPIRDVARLRAALLLVDTGSYADVAGRAEQLSTDTNPLRFSAREALGLAAWKEGRSDDALKLFDQISADAQAPAGVRRRAGVMTGLIRGGADAS